MRLAASALTMLLMQGVLQQSKVLQRVLGLQQCGASDVEAIAPLLQHALHHIDDLPGTTTACVYCLQPCASFCDTSVACELALCNLAAQAHATSRSVAAL